MGTEARLGLLLGAAACLLAVMVDWVVEELSGEDAPATPAGSVPLPDMSRTPDGTPIPV